MLSDENRDNFLIEIEPEDKTCGREETRIDGGQIIKRSPSCLFQSPRDHCERIISLSSERIEVALVADLTYWMRYTLDTRITRCCLPSVCFNHLRKSGNLQLLFPHRFILTLITDYSGHRPRSRWLPIESRGDQMLDSSA